MVHPSVHHLPLPFGGVAPSHSDLCGKAAMLKAWTEVVLLVTGHAKMQESGH